MSSIDRIELNPYQGDLTIYIKDLRAQEARKRPLTVKSWSRVQDIKNLLQSLLNVPTGSQRLFYRGKELKNHRILHDQGIYESGQTIFFAAVDVGSLSQKYSLEIYGSLDPPRHLLRCLNQAKRALDLGFAPSLALEGTGGTYFLTDTRRRKVAAFKPLDEEPFTPNNPRGLVGSYGKDGMCMRPGITPGEACVREVAAYILDRGHFSRVPQTVLAEVRHPSLSHLDGRDGRRKLGSFQEFVEHDEMVADISPSKLSVASVHRIAILDMRLLNMDRNDANILVRRRRQSSDKGNKSHRRAFPPHAGGSGGGGSNGSNDSNGTNCSPKSVESPGSNSDSRWQGTGGGGGINSNSNNDGRNSSGSSSNEVVYELIPIDHGYCLPYKIEIGWCDWCWIDWPQLKRPLDADARAYVLALDPEADVRRVRQKLSLREPCLRNFRISSMLLQEGVRSGLTLLDIANVIVRHDLDSKSELELLVDRAEALAHAALENNAHGSFLSKILSPSKSPPSAEQKRLKLKAKMKVRKQREQKREQQQRRDYERTKSSTSPVEGDGYDMSYENEDSTFEASREDGGTSPLSDAYSTDVDDETDEDDEEDEDDDDDDDDDDEEEEEEAEEEEDGNVDDVDEGENVEEPGDVASSSESSSGSSSSDDNEGFGFWRESMAVIDARNLEEDDEEEFMEWGVDWEQQQRQQLQEEQEEEKEQHIERRSLLAGGRDRRKNGGGNLEQQPLDPLQDGIDMPSSRLGRNRKLSQVGEELESTGGRRDSNAVTSPKVSGQGTAPSDVGKLDVYNLSTLSRGEEREQRGRQLCDEGQGRRGDHDNDQHNGVTTSSDSSEDSPSNDTATTTFLSTSCNEQGGGQHRHGHSSLEEGEGEGEGTHARKSQARPPPLRPSAAIRGPIQRLIAESSQEGSISPLGSSRSGSGSSTGTGGGGSPSNSSKGKGKAKGHLARRLANLQLDDVVVNTPTSDVNRTKRMGPSSTSSGGSNDSRTSSSGRPRSCSPKSLSPKERAPVGAPQAASSSLSVSSPGVNGQQGRALGGLAGSQTVTKNPLPRVGKDSSADITPEGSLAASSQQRDALSQPVAIQRSFSYHGLRSQALYDPTTRERNRSHRRKPGKDSPEFAAAFFRFIDVLVKELVKKKCKEAGEQAGTL